VGIRQIKGRFFEVGSLMIYAGHHVSWPEDYPSQFSS
jgi:hypothetical protein